ncbi:MAG: hypothetical protein HQK91_15210 [Nitrospirae bacterium]|nr:hypothetical protein [Nitrospirota bacterium]
MFGDKIAANDIPPGGTRFIIPGLVVVVVVGVEVVVVEAVVDDVEVVVVVEIGFKFDVNPDCCCVVPAIATFFLKRSRLLNKLCQSTEKVINL